MGGGYCIFIMSLHVVKALVFLKDVISSSGKYPQADGPASVIAWSQEKAPFLSAWGGAPPFREWIPQALSRVEGRVDTEGQIYCPWLKREISNCDLGLSERRSTDVLKSPSTSRGERRHSRSRPGGRAETAGARARDIKTTRLLPPWGPGGMEG